MKPPSCQDGANVHIPQIEKEWKDQMIAAHWTPGMPNQRTWPPGLVSKSRAHYICFQQARSTVPTPDELYLLESYIRPQVLLLAFRLLQESQQPTCVRVEANIKLESILCRGEPCQALNTLSITCHDNRVPAVDWPPCSCNVPIRPASLFRSSSPSLKSPCHSLPTNMPNSVAWTLT